MTGVIGHQRHDIVTTILTTMTTTMTPVRWQNPDVGPTTLVRHDDVARHDDVTRHVTASPRTTTCVEFSKRDAARFASANHGRPRDADFLFLFFWTTRQSPIAWNLFVCCSSSREKRSVSKLRRRLAATSRRTCSYVGRKHAAAISCLHSVDRRRARGEHPQVTRATGA